MKWQPTPVFLPGESHGKRNLAGYSTWGCKESDMTENSTQKKIMSLITLENWPEYPTKNAKILFPLKIVIGMEQIGSGNRNIQDHT